MEKVVVMAVLVVCGFWIGWRLLGVFRSQGCSSGCGCDCSSCPEGKNSVTKQR